MGSAHLGFGPPPGQTWRHWRSSGQRFLCAGTVLGPFPGIKGKVLDVNFVHRRNTWASSWPSAYLLLLSTLNRFACLWNQHAWAFSRWRQWRSCGYQLLCAGTLLGPLPGIKGKALDANFAHRCNNWASSWPPEYLLLLTLLEQFAC